MPNDTFTIAHDTTGANLYALIRDRDGKVADVAVDQAFETFADASLGDYDLAGTEQGTASQCYAFTFPAWIAAGTYTVHVYERAGGSPAVTDDLVAQGVIEWDGSAIVSQAAKLLAIEADTNELQTDLADGGRLDLIFDAIVADTNELQTDLADGGRLDLIFDAIVADTNELQTDLADGGRLDLIFDAIVADTSELQTDLADGGRLDLIFDAIKADAIAIEKLLRADEYIITTTTPWTHVKIEEGTGAPGVGTALLTRNLKTTAGANITDTETVIGQAVA